MTMRTYTYFQCPNGHQGTEKLTENDQPYSTPWERTEYFGVYPSGKDEKGHVAYWCEECGLQMKVVPKPST